MSNRNAILRGVKAANDAHLRLHDRAMIQDGRRWNIDVFGAIISQDVPLVFRPLTGLLGACMEGPGILISTRRSLPIQRFTAAHEFGHYSMAHPLSLDGEEILTGDFSAEKADFESEANAFASEFLLPRWLLTHHAKQQGWDRGSMSQAAIVYQMALRVGASYEATVWSLAKFEIISTAARNKLLSVQPRTIKQEILGNYEPENWYRDVWVLTMKDEGARIEGQPDDLFVFHLNEKASSGYLWDLDTIKRNGFAIVTDQREIGEDAIGSDSLRKLVVKGPNELSGEVRLVQRRPWIQEGSDLTHFGVRYDLKGRENGMPRAQRPVMARAA